MFYPIKPNKKQTIETIAVLFGLSIFTLSYFFIKKIRNNKNKAQQITQKSDDIPEDYNIQENYDNNQQIEVKILSNTLNNNRYIQHIRDNKKTIYIAMIVFCIISIFIVLLVLIYNEPLLASKAANRIYNGVTTGAFTEPIKEQIVIPKGFWDKFFDFLRHPINLFDHSWKIITTFLVVALGVIFGCYLLIKKDDNGERGITKQQLAIESFNHLIKKDDNGERGITKQQLAIESFDKLLDEKIKLLNGYAQASAKAKAKTKAKAKAKAAAKMFASEQLPLLNTSVKNFGFYDLQKLKVLCAKYKLIRARIILLLGDGECNPIEPSELNSLYKDVVFEENIQLEPTIQDRIDSLYKDVVFEKNIQLEPTIQDRIDSLYKDKNPPVFDGITIEKHTGCKIPNKFDEAKNPTMEIEENKNDE